MWFGKLLRQTAKLLHKSWKYRLEKKPAKKVTREKKETVDSRVKVFLKSIFIKTFFNIFKVCLSTFWSVLRHTGWFFIFFVGYPGRELNLGCRDGNMASNQLDHPNSLLLYIGNSKSLSELKKGFTGVVSMIEYIDISGGRMGRIEGYPYIRVAAFVVQ